MKDSEILGVRMPLEEKRILSEIAQANFLTMSDLARLFIKDGISHMGERNILST